MVVAITGGRDYSPSTEERAELFELFEALGGTVLVQGDARGCDREVAGWARMRGIEVVPYGVNEKVDGPWPGAGPKRNRRMLVDSGAEVLVAFQGGSGTADCCEQARKMGVTVHEVRP